MGLACTIGTMLAVILSAWVMCRWNPRLAYRLLDHSQHMLFEPDDISKLVPIRTQPWKSNVTLPRGAKQAVKRPHISPLIKKRVAARQRWRCAICRELLDETYEIDHIIPLFQGGHPTQESNLQALCKRDHMFKTAVLDRS